MRICSCVSRTALSSSRIWSRETAPGSALRLAVPAAGAPPSRAGGAWRCVRAVSSPGWAVFLGVAQGASVSEGWWARRAGFDESGLDRGAPGLEAPGIGVAPLPPLRVAVFRVISRAPQPGHTTDAAGIRQDANLGAAARTLHGQALGPLGPREKRPNRQYSVRVDS